MNFISRLIGGAEEADDKTPQWQLDHPDWPFDRQAAGRKAAATNRERYGDGSDGKEDYFARLGRRGGAISRGGHFTLNGDPKHDAQVRENARKAGSRGGKAPRRKKSEAA